MNNAFKEGVLAGIAGEDEYFSNPYGGSASRGFSANHVKWLEGHEIGSRLRVLADREKPGKPERHSLSDSLTMREWIAGVVLMAELDCLDEEARQNIVRTGTAMLEKNP